MWLTARSRSTVLLVSPSLHERSFFLNWQFLMRSVTTSFTPTFFLTLHHENVDFLINAAAYTAVDKAESDIEFAYLLNEKAVGNLAAAAKEHGTFFVHVSTDYVFDGKSDRPVLLPPFS